ncbi:cell division control protein 42 homolog [Gigantopelta aegis]|uniref:cell division control protein 42 homolog n=1 Tax=Gigantopelta aegis TaxID=1735272 RepID=UPI001B88B99F|nr:cell division control protein 42 homolog [Gigantopelta aegis]
MVTEKRRNIKCVVVGDDSVGKTSMLMGYATCRYPTQHVPSVFDNHAGTLIVRGRKLHLELIDTDEQDKYEEKRQFVYTGTDVFVVCFSVVQPDSLKHVEDVWLPEIRHMAPKTPFILVGTQADLREADVVLNMLQSNGQIPVSPSAGSEFARKVGAACYIECSPGVEKKLRRTVNNALASVIKLREGGVYTSPCTIL